MTWLLSASKLPGICTVHINLYSATVICDHSGYGSSLWHGWCALSQAQRCVSPSARSAQCSGADISVCCLFTMVVIMAGQREKTCAQMDRLMHDGLWWTANWTYCNICDRKCRQYFIFKNCFLELTAENYIVLVDWLQCVPKHLEHVCSCLGYLHWLYFECRLFWSLTTGPVSFNIWRVDCRSDARPLLRQLHWPSVRQRIMYKTAVLTRRASTTSVPVYLKEHLVPRPAARQTRSAALLLLTVPRLDHWLLDGHFHMLHLSPGTVYLQTLHFLILNTVLNANSRLSYSNSPPDWHSTSASVA